MNCRRPRVVITGMGVVSAAGCDLRAFWQRLAAGDSVVRPIRRFDASAYPTRIGAEIDDSSVQSRTDRRVAQFAGWRIAQYAMAATACAVEDAGLTPDCLADANTGVSIATGMGSYDHEEVFASCSAARSSTQGDFDWEGFVATLRRTLKERGAERRTPGSVAAHIGRNFACRGPVMSTMTACSGGTQAIGDAARWIHTGRAATVLAGAADSELYPMGLASFCLLGALSRRNETPWAASRPFDAGRDGFVIGEGAGMLVLEERTQALRRGARIYAEVGGFGSASDAFRATDPHPDGIGAVLAMRRAIADAGLSPADIEYLNAHGTSTVANDQVETLAIKRVFGERAPRIPISSTKSIIGHAMVAAGAVEAVATVLTIAHRTIHPTINQETPDPLCDLDYVPNRARGEAVEVAMSNSFAFGGQCASLVLKRDHD